MKTKSNEWLIHEINRLNQEIVKLDGSLSGRGEEIHENKALLKAIIEGFEGYIYVASPDYRIEFLNQALTQVIGRNAANDICYEAIHERTSPCPFCQMTHIQQGDVKRFEANYPRNGRWYSCANSPICHMDGRISLLAMVTDIHECKLAEIAAKERELSLQQKNIALLSSIRDRHQFGKIVGKSRPIQKVYDLIVNTAATDATAIIYGEPGTGKELVARAIHDLSERRDKPFVPIHCGAIPENLVESEFFGYKKGAFSGAGADKPGYLDFGDGGTLFLDEVGEISLHMQVKLLRMIEGGGYTPVGSSQVRHSDVRIIAATNRDLKTLIKQKLIREDFYYRIHILPIQLPPLRNRKEDIPLLVAHFMSIHAGKRNVPPFSQDMLDRLDRYDWPGNVRELQNVIIRYCNQGTLDFFEPSAPPFMKDSAGASHYAPADTLQPLGDIGLLVEAYEKQIILTALEQCHWQRQQAAALLKIDRKTLFNKMKRYRISSSRTAHSPAPHA